MRFTSGGAFAWSGTDAVPLLLANSAPSGAVGQSCLLGGVAGRVADEWYVRMRAADTKTTIGCTMRLWAYVAELWDPGTLYTLKLTSDADGGASLVIPGIGAATRIYLEAVTLVDGGGADPGLILEAFHSEHGEAQ